MFLTKIQKRKARRDRRRKNNKVNKRLRKLLLTNVLSASCHYCQKEFTADDLTIEHIIPRSQGGTNDIENVTLACLPCNQEKGRETFLQRRNETMNNYIFAIICNVTPEIHNVEFFYSYEKACEGLKLIADKRRSAMGVRVVEDTKDKFSFVMGWEGREVKFTVIKLPINK